MYIRIVKCLFYSKSYYLYRKRTDAYQKKVVIEIAGTPLLKRLVLCIVQTSSKLKHTFETKRQSFVLDRAQSVDFKTCFCCWCCLRHRRYPLSRRKIALSSSLQQDSPIRIMVSTMNGLKTPSTSPESFRSRPTLSRTTLQLFASEKEISGTSASKRTKSGS